MSSTTLYETTPQTGTVSSTNLTSLYSNTGNFTAGTVNTSVLSVNGGTGVTVSPTTGNVVVSIGQDVATTANVTFANLTATGNLSNNYFTLANSAGTNGQVLTTNGAGVTTWTSASGLGLVNSVTGSGAGISVSPTTGAVIVSNTGVTSITGTANQIIASASTGAVTLSTPQDIATTSNVNFGSVTTSGDIAVNGGDLTTTATTFNLLNTTATTLNLGGAATTMSIGAGTGTTTVNNNLKSTGSLSNNYFTLPNSTGTNGQVLVSNGSTAPAWTNATSLGLVDSITGTANQIIASASTGAVTLSTPQDIATTSSPTFNSLTLTTPLAVSSGGTGRAVGNYSIYANEIHVGKDGNDTTGDGTLINPVLTITKALTLIGAGRNTVIVHPGSYSESPTVSSANTTISTTELTGANTQISGTLTLSAAARVSGIKLTNLTITGSGNTYISNCTVDTQVIKSGSNYVEIINSELQCVSGIQITGAGTMSIIGNKCWAVAVSNASANVLIKDCFQVITPSVTAGTLQIDGSAIFAASPSSNAVTSSASSFITLANSFVLNSAGTNVERVSLSGFYSILNLVYDKPNSTLIATSGTGGNLNAIDYFSVVNADTVAGTSGLTLSTVGSNGDITLAPNGSGDVFVYADTLWVGDQNVNASITTNGTGNLALTTNNNSNSGSITITQGANGNITLSPYASGTGIVTVSSELNVDKGLRLTASSSGYSKFTVPASGSNLDYVLPGSAGAANTVLTNDGSGTLSWALPGGGGSTFGNVSIGVDTDQTISTTSGNLILQTAAGVNAGTMTFTSGTNGAITLAPNGSGNVVNTFGTGGNATNNRSYVTGAIRSGTGTVANNYTWATNGALNTQPFRGISVDNSADTAVNAGYVARNYSSAANNRSRIIFERARGTAASPTAVQSGDFIGSIEATGCNAAGVFVNDALQTGATTTTVPGLISFTAAETWSAGSGSGPIFGTTFAVTLAPTATPITSGTSLIAVLTANPQTFDTRSDAHSFKSKAGTNLMTIDSDGRLQVFNTNATANNNIYGYRTKILTSTTEATAGNNIELKPGKLTGTTAFDKQTQVAVIQNTTDGSVYANLEVKTQRYNGTTYSPTQTGDSLGRFLFNGNYVSGATPATAAAGGSLNVNATENWTSTAHGTKINLNIVKTGTLTGISVLDMGDASSTFRSDSYTFQSSAGTSLATISSTGIGFPVKTAAQWNAITGSVGMQVCVSDSPINGGKMAYWDTTNARWSYIDTNTAI